MSKLTIKKPNKNDDRNCLSLLQSIKEDTSVEDRTNIIVDFATELQKHKPLEQMMLKGQAVDILKEKGVRAPAALINLALKNPTGEEPETSNIKGAVEPWDSPVDGSELFKELVYAFNRHVVVEPMFVHATILWVFHTHCHDVFRKSPILNVHSGEKGSGKTTFLSVVQALVHKPFSASNVTKAVIFRTIDLEKPTVIFDEADTWLGADKEMIGILNSGHDYAFASVSRMVRQGDDWVPGYFSTWAPKVLAAIGDIPDTLRDRSIIIRMRRKLASEKVQPLDREAIQRLTVLKRKIVRWVKDNEHLIGASNPDMPKLRSDRSLDNWKPLMAIGEVLGEDILEDTTDAVIRYSSYFLDDDSIGAELLHDIYVYFDENQVTRVSSVDLASWLGSLPDRPWGTIERGKAITPFRLSKILKRFMIRPNPTRMSQKLVLRGYDLDQFEDAFQRYVYSETENDVTPLQAPAENGANDSSSVDISKEQ